LASGAVTGQDRQVTESNSPLENALDLVLYAPVGLALTAAEEIPKLAAKGRAQLEGQLTMARVVGQFAVAQGRKELKKRLSPPPSTGRGAEPEDGRRPGQPSTPGARGRRPEAAGGKAAGSGAAGGGAAGGQGQAAVSGPQAGGQGQAAGPGPQAGGAFGSSDDRDLTTAAARREQAGAGPLSTAGEHGGPGSRPAARSLAIPGYDSLAASQVVQRLAGLSKDELEAVGAYEAAHRSRRTILSRIRQLQES
jgi:hypothetical protein